jgi:hypothetical protein
MVWLISALVFLGLCALLNAVLPHPPSRLGRLLRRPLRFLTKPFRRRANAVPDPFDTLRLQTRLGHLAGEIRRMETAPRIYARAHRLMAIEAAYDDLLDEACELAGVCIEAELRRGEERRWYEEQELASRGWSW